MIPHYPRSTATLLRNELVPRDEQEGEAWLEKAGARKVTKALFELGIRRFEAGKMSQALYWFKQAAELGHPRARVKTGDMFRMEVGVAADPCQACT